MIAANLNHLTKMEREALLAFREKLYSAFPGKIKQIILFGSKARGDDHLESDIDLLVLLETLDRESRNAVYEIAASIEEEHGYVIELSPHVWDEETFHWLLSHERRIALDIKNEGVPV